MSALPIVKALLVVPSCITTVPLPSPPSELNNPREQLARFTMQQRDKLEGGDPEAQDVDKDFCGKPLS